MTGDVKSRVRASTVLDSAYESEGRLLSDLEKTDEATRGKLLRALVRAGFKDSHSNTATTHAGQQGGDHGA